MLAIESFFLWLAAGVIRLLNLAKKGSGEGEGVRWGGGGDCLKGTDMHGNSLPSFIKLLCDDISWEINLQFLHDIDLVFFLAVSAVPLLLASSQPFCLYA